jgi:hypothetical protein
MISQICSADLYPDDTDALILSIVINRPNSFNTAVQPNLVSVLSGIGVVYAADLSVYVGERPIAQSVPRAIR